MKKILNSSFAMSLIIALSFLLTIASIVITASKSLVIDMGKTYFPTGVVLLVASILLGVVATVFLVKSIENNK